MIKQFIVGSCNIEKWLHQNKAEYTGDYIEGVLLDNFVVMTKSGFAAVYEKNATPNSSVYRIEWESGTAQEVFRRWYEFEKMMNDREW